MFNCYVKDNLSQNGYLILSTSQDHVEHIYSYKRQFEQLSIISQHQMDTIVK